MKHTLASLEITNGEGAEIEILAAFLNWMRSENIPIPQGRKEFNALAVRWIIFCRHTALQRLHEEGKISDSAFKRLTWRTQ